MSGCFRNPCPDISGMVVRVLQEYLSGYYRNAVRVLQESPSKGFQHATIGVSKDEEPNRNLYYRMGFTKTIKECFFDPCARDENMRPEPDEGGYLLLSKDL